MPSIIHKNINYSNGYIPGIADLLDADAENPSTNDILLYDEVSGTWKATPLSANKVAYGNNSTVKDELDILGSDADILFEGNALSGTLDDSVLNYRYVIIRATTNIDNQFQIIPRDFFRKCIGTSQNIQIFGFAISAAGQNTSWPYQSALFITFPTATSFTTSLNYNNPNWTWTVTDIYGVK